MKKNEGAILKFVGISSQTSTANEKQEVSSGGNSISQMKAKETVDLVKSNKEAFVDKSRSMDEASPGLAKTEFDDVTISHNDVVTWPKVITYNMRFEMVKAVPESYENKERLFQPGLKVMQEGNKETGSLSFLE